MGADCCHFTDPKTGEERDSHHEVLLMVQNSGDHHLGWCKNPENNGINYRFSTAAGFLPSTV